MSCNNHTNHILSSLIAIYYNNTFSLAHVIRGCDKVVNEEVLFMRIRSTRVWIVSSFMPADIIIENGYAAITLLGNKANIEAKAAEWGLKNIAKADIIDPLNNPKKDFYANMLYEIRKNKGMTP
jgi:phosphotransacetylase